MNRINIIFVILLIWGSGRVGWGQTSHPTQATRTPETGIAALEARIVQIEARIAQLEEEVRRLRQAVAELRAARALDIPVGVEEDLELARLRQEIATLSETPPEPPTPPPTEAPPIGPTTSGALNLNRLNPEISVTGDVVVHRPLTEETVPLGLPEEHGETAGEVHGETSREFSVREVEFSFISMLDPYSRMKLFVSWEDGALHLEEAYAEWMALPGRLRLIVGRQYLQLGVLNRWHRHAFPQIDTPLVMREYLGEENLAQTGVHLAWLLPRWWGASSEIILSLGAGDAEGFQGSALTRPTWFVYWNQYFDLSPATYLEFGVSTIGGLLRESPRLRHRIWNAFVRLNWTPPARAKYRSLDIWAEVFWNRQETFEETDGTLPQLWSRWGGFAFFEYRLNRRWLMGLRWDFFERMDVDGTHVWAFSPVVTFWQSEWVRFRLQYSFIRWGTIRDQRFLFQVTWAAGPHKHEAY